MSRDVKSRVTLDGGSLTELFWGFTPWADDLPDFVPTTDGDHARRISRKWRGIYDHRDGDERRVLIEIDEEPSHTEALNALGRGLEINQLTLDPGPAGLGVISFIAPLGHPPVASFVRGNLCVTVASFGELSVDATAIAQRLHSRLETRTKAARTIALSVESREAASPDSAALFVKFDLDAQERSEQPGFVVVEVEGGTATQAPGAHRLAITAATSEVRLRVYSFAPGREPVPDPPGFMQLVCDTRGCGWAEWRTPQSRDVVLKRDGRFRCDFCKGGQPGGPSGLREETP